METTLTEIQSKLKAWRGGTITQEQAARKLGVSVTTYARWEQGTNKPSRMALRVINRVVTIPTLSEQQ